MTPSDADFLQGPEEEAATAEDLRANYHRFAIFFSVFQGVAIAPVPLATSCLDTDAGFIGNAVFCTCMLVSSLLLSVPATSAAGLKASILAGMSGAAALPAFFAVAVSVGREAAQAQVLLYSCGACSAGIASGVL